MYEFLGKLFVFIIVLTITSVGAGFGFSILGVSISSLPILKFLLGYALIIGSYEFYSYTQKMLFNKD